MSSILQVEGGHPLRGEITVRGAKNFVPKAMVASLLADTPSELYNVPLIRDTDVVSDLLSLHGVQIDFDQDRGTLRMDPSNVKIASRSDIDTLAGASRIPILFCGPLLHQLGEAFIPELGGCAIGGRPIDFHLETLRKFGAIVDKQPDGVHIKRPATGLHGAIIELPFPSVGATEQTLLTAVRNEGITTLKGAAIEPEILDLINVLQKMGAIISVDTDRTIRIEGVAKLTGYRHTALPVCPSFTRPCTRTASALPRRCARWARTFRSTASAWAARPVASARRTTITRRLSRVRPRCTARISWSRTCAVASRT